MCTNVSKEHTTCIYRLEAHTINMGSPDLCSPKLRYSPTRLHGVITPKTTGCPKNLDPIGIVSIFLIFIYRLKLNVKRLKMALTLDERVEIVLLSGRMDQRDKWRMSLMPDCCATVDPNMLSKIGTNMVKQLRKCVVCWSEHVEHIL
jgi:hypothetical protein